MAVLKREILPVGHVRILVRRIEAALIRITQQIPVVIIIIRLVSMEMKRFLNNFRQPSAFLIKLVFGCRILNVVHRLNHFHFLFFKNNTQKEK